MRFWVELDQVSQWDRAVAWYVIAAIVGCTRTTAILFLPKWAAYLTPSYVIDQQIDLFHNYPMEITYFDHVYSFWVFKLTCLQLAIPPCRFNVWGISLCFALTDSILHNTHSVRSHIFNSRLEIGPSPQQHYGHGEAFNLATWSSLRNGRANINRDRTNATTFYVHWRLEIAYGHTRVKPIIWSLGSKFSQEVSLLHEGCFTYSNKGRK